MSGANSMCCPNCGQPMVGPEFGYTQPWAVAYPPAFNAPPVWTSQGCPTDEQVLSMIYDALDADPAIPYDSDIDVDVTGGVVTLTGTVPNKRIKHFVGDDAWWVPGVWDINNNLEIVPRVRRAEATGGQRPMQAGSER